MIRQIVVVSVCMLGVFYVAPPASAADGMDADIGTPGRPFIRLHNYNNWHFNGAAPEELDRQLELVARRDNICYTEGWERYNEIEGWRKVTPQSIKKLNPGAKVYRLYALMCKPTWDTDWNKPSDTRRMLFPITRAVIDANDWWLRGADGEILKESESQWFVDIGKPGFKEAFLQAVLERNRDKGFDGFVFDYLVSNLSWALDPIGADYPPEYPTNEDWFYKAWKPFFEYVVRGVQEAGYKVVGNCAGEYGDANILRRWQRTLVDGTVYEQGAVNWRDTGGAWLNGWLIERRIDALENDRLDVWFANNGIRHDAPDFERKVVVSLAMYYIGIPPSQGNRSYHYSYDWKPFWQPLWDFHIGEPEERRVQVYVDGRKKYAWKRKYSQGMVLLNYEAEESVTYSLDGDYRTPEGRLISGEATLPARTAMILMKNAPGPDESTSEATQVDE